MSIPPSRPLAPARLSAALTGFALVWAASAHAAPPEFEDNIAQRVQACTTCHGAQGRAGPDGYYPRLAGKPAGYLYNQLLNFRDERRRYRPMNHLLDRLPDAYLREMAEHFARQQAPYPAPQPAAVPAAVLAHGERLVRQGDPARQLPACAACHGAALTGLAPNVPGLLGLPRDYLNGQLGAWQNGQRQAHAPDCMAQIARQLTSDDVSALSAWLAAQPLPADPHAVASLPAPLPLRCGTAPQSLAGSPR